MARSHSLHSWHPSLGLSRAERPTARSGSAGFAHLRCMEPATTSPSPTTAPLENADLRSQGRGPTGFRVGRHLRFRKFEIEAWLVRLEGEDSVRRPGGEAR